jgi:hypothetical protein
VEPEYVMKNFVPVALDTYFRGDSQEEEFCRKVKAGGNHIVAATAGGQALGAGAHLRLREKELSKVLDEFKALAEADRKPALPDIAAAAAPKRPLPPPPPNGLILKGYCAYVRRDDDGRLQRSTEWYYKENPDRWAAETQNDFLWMTEAEWKALVPADPKAGDRADVPAPLQKRFFGTLAIDYMEGSVNSLAVRESTMTLTVEKASAEAVELRLDGYGKLGRGLDEAARQEKNSRGGEARVLGRLRYDRSKKAFDRFDVVGAGEAWGNKMEYVRREVRLDRYPWLYGIAFELVKGDRAEDRIPPYNMLHYGGATQPYFGGK